MNRRVHRAVALVTAVAAAATSFVLPGAGIGLALANGVTFGGLAWFSIAHADLLLGGGQPWRVARWSGAIGGLSVLVSMTVMTVGLSSATPGERVAVAALAFGATWTGVGLGVSLARDRAAVVEERRARQDPWDR